MSQKLPENSFEWIEDTFQFKKVFIEKSPFLTEKMKVEKIEKLGANLRDKTEYLIHIGNLKQALNHVLVLTKVHRDVKFNQNAWLNSYIDMNTDLRKTAKNDFEKYFFTLMNNLIKIVLEKLWRT